MQASQRARELERVYQNRRGHVPQISISDDNHHVTEAIGDMYGDGAYARHDPRPLSFISTPPEGRMEGKRSYFDGPRSSPTGTSFVRTTSNERPPQPVNGSLKMSPTHSSPPISPPQLNRNTSDTATQQFPLNDIDYESSPAAVAQELSNLQAIRRMSMGVSASDPDLPSFGSSFGMPTIAPAHGADEEDPSRLFWVPARLHPELAPKDYQSFVDDRMNRIKRRSGGEDTLSPDGIERRGSGGGLRRKRSMLSRQIDSSSGYKDGAERLERKRSSSNQTGQEGVNLHELEQLVSDPSSLVRRLSLDTARKSQDSSSEVPASQDMPILPPKPSGPALKRSTRTTYRRGSLRNAPFSKRAASLQTETDTEDSPISSPVTSVSEEPKFGLTKVQTGPIPSLSTPPENFSRPGRKPRSPPPPASSAPSDDVPQRPDLTAPSEQPRARSPPAKTFQSRIASNGRTTAPLPGYNQSIPPVPQIIETPPSTDSPRNRPLLNLQLPERKPSHEFPPSVPPQAPLPDRPSPTRNHNRPTLLRQSPSTKTPVTTPTQTLDDMAAHPSPLPGNSTRTDTLSFIPTFADDKKTERKPSDKRDAQESGGRKASWGWFLGGEDKSKERERKEKEEASKKAKSKLAKPVEKSHDNTRLDVLQTSIDGNRGRESLVLDRESYKLEEERKKESNRKTSGESKKEKDKESGIFSSLFGGGKKKGDRDSSGKKGSSLRGLSPEPPPRILKPDIDYNWTRFSILEERAIYRMAHIKLANPRRELYSQVLLSNFMYSYLAKVQQMHPQIQVPQSPAQKQQQHQQQQHSQSQHHPQQLLQLQSRQPVPQPPQQKRPETQQQPEEFAQYQRYQEQQARMDSLASSPTQQTTSLSPVSPVSGNGTYASLGNRPDSRGSQNSLASQISTYSNSNGSTYTVASGSAYLGQPVSKYKQPYQQQSIYGNTGPSGKDSMW